jgi:trigger factor
MGEPDLDPESLEVHRDDAFRFTTEVDVRPEFELAAYKNLVLHESIEPVTDEEVESRLEALRENFADQTPADGPAAAGHLVEGTVVLTCGDEELVNQEGRAVRLEGSSFFGYEVGDLVEHLGGATPGETREIPFTIPEEHPREDLRGQPATIRLSVEKVLASQLPEVDDAFAGRLGMQSVDQLRQQIKESIESDRRTSAREETERELIDKLIEANPFDLPEQVLEHLTQSSLERSKAQMQYMGRTPEEIEAATEELTESSRQEAERTVRRMIILDAIAEKEEITVTEADFQQHLQMLSQAYRTPPADLLKNIEQRGGLASMENEIRDIKVTQLLLDEAEIQAEAPSADATPDAES